MGRRAPEAAAVAPAPAAPPKKARTIAAMDAEARALVSRRKLAHDAATYAHENKIGSKAALKTGKFGGPDVVTYNMVEPLLRQLKQNGKFDDDGRDHHSQILTNNERHKLADWIPGLCGWPQPQGPDADLVEDQADSASAARA